ncbi:MAG: glycosyltransferase [Flavobacteriaceae bacterium]|nr:glycosyltransferase [Flavobacteriaceae bacterium]
MNNIDLLIFCFVTSFYLLLIIFLAIGVKKLKVFIGFKTHQQNSFSIIIPFRNEAQNLNALLESLRKIQYSQEQFEIIFVNDSSTDNSVNIVEDFIIQNSAFQIKILHNNLKALSPKKEALEKSIKIAKYEWIVTTDADCVVPNLWLKTLNEFIELSNCDMIVAPVVFTTNHTFLQDFQQLDFLSLMGATQGGFAVGYPFLCNGANLCYRKSVFNDVDGFEGNKKMASGDDIFLMEKFLTRNKNSIKYLKSYNAIVKSQPQKSIKEFINQRIRWASKTTAYKNNSGKIVGVIVLSMNFLLFISFIFLYLKWISLVEILLFWILKIVVDYFLLLMISQFYQTKIAIKKYLIFSLIYPFYTVIIGLLSFSKKYEWKGRKY